MLKTATKTTLYENVVAQIVAAIKQNRWTPGERIAGELELANSFGVSRNCVREALKSLELSGIITSRPGRGTYITDDALRNIHNNEFIKLITSECSVEELFETRLIIEPQAAYLAAKRATAADKEKLTALFTQLREYIFARRNWAEVGMRFHMTIVEMARNRILLKLILSLRDELQIERGLVYQQNTGDEAMIREHEAIYQAILENDPAKARNAMSTHLQQAWKILESTADTPIS